MSRPGRYQDASWTNHLFLAGRPRRQVTREPHLITAVMGQEVLQKDFLPLSEEQLGRRAFGMLIPLLSVIGRATVVVRRFTSLLGHWPMRFPKKPARWRRFLYLCSLVLGKGSASLEPNLVRR